MRLKRREGGAARADGTVHMLQEVGPARTAARRARPSEIVDVGVGREAYARWREEAITPRLFDLEVEQDTFRNDFQRWWLGELPLIAFDQSGASYSRSQARARRDGVDGLWLQVTTTGGIDAASPDGRVHMGPGTAALCDLGRPVEQRTHAGIGRIVILPRDAFGAGDLGPLHGAVARGGRHDILNDFLTWLMEAPGPASAGSEHRWASSIAAVVTACVGATPRTPEAAVAALSGVTVRRATAYIDQRLSDPDLTVAEIARAVGVSRASLYRACTAAGGVDALVWERRLQAVRAMLSDPGEHGRLGDIAARCGFSHASHFSSRFKERFGFSPSDLRPYATAPG